MEKGTFKAGLEDVIAVNSEICFIDGQKARLIYRGYDINDLVAHVTFEEVAYLLWEGSLPTRAQLDDLKARITSHMVLHPQLLELLRRFPREATPMEVLRTAVSAAGMLDPSRQDNSLEANRRRAVLLMGLTPVVVTAWHRLGQGLEPLAPKEGLSLAANFLYMLTGTEPTPLETRAFDVALTLHADHELNASTFAARVTVATLSDMYSAITSAIGALKGPLHGGANEQVMRMLREVQTVDRAESWVKEALAAKKRIPGFGHRVYRTGDPRAAHLKELSRQLSQQRGDTRWFELSQAIEEIMLREKGLYPNVDFYSASVYDALGIPTELFTPVFAVSRMSGWTAHVLEQLSDNRLIRPRANYVGPTDLKVVPIDQR